MFGALTLAYSDSRRHYDLHDLVFGGEIARRAAVAIDNAKLYELSQQERSRVEAATRAKDEFVAMVSHELRTPLNSILGWLRLMRGGALDEAKRAHALEVIERNAEAQSQLVADLLDISRVITGKIRINPSQMDFANVVDMAVEGVGRPQRQSGSTSTSTSIANTPSSAAMRIDSSRSSGTSWRTR
jgi:signal transduction histidine kinase